MTEKRLISSRFSYCAGFKGFRMTLFPPQLTNNKRKKERKGNKTENVIQLLDWFNGVLIGVYLLLPRCLFLFHSFLAKGHTLDLVCWSMRTNYLLIWDFCPNPNVILRLPLALMDNESPVDQKICTHSVGGASGSELREFTSKILDGTKGGLSDDITV